MTQPYVSVLIPARNEPLLSATIRDVLAKAAGPVEVIVNLDERSPLDPLPVQDERVYYLRPPTPQGMRAGIVAAAGIAQGEYLMKLDAHCMLDQSWDVKLRAACPYNWVVIPRRYRLDPHNWAVLNDGRPPVDYEHFIYPRKYNPPSLHGFRWEERQAEREEEDGRLHDIDDDMTFQGSCWFMQRTHFDQYSFLQDPGYQGVPQQEAEEIGLTTWMNGGRVKVNKNVWYAHLFKGKERGQGYAVGKAESEAAYAYSYKHWVLERRAEFTALVERFWPIPGWPEDWASKIYKEKANVAND